MARLPRSGFLPALAAAILAAASAGALRAGGPPIGFAVSDDPFYIEGAETFGNGTILEGETVVTNYLPLRIALSSGAKLALGPGSEAAVWREKARLVGVSLDVQVPQSEPFTVESGGVELALDAGSHAVVFSDRPDLTSVWLDSGALRAFVSGQQVASIGAGQAVTVSQVDGRLRVNEQRASLEAGRIQIRQLRHLRSLGVVRPAIQPRCDALLRELATASNGALEASPNDEKAEQSALPIVDHEKMLAAARSVHRAMLSGYWAQAGCGSPDCVHREKVRSPNDFHGWAGGLPPGRRSCELCRRPSEAVALE
ncbi:MAG: hypothetical protein GC160_16600 [Acidobacteria bacterium]|nr:hypothetical protein [Acidobacteriota bacterium]